MNIFKKLLLFALIIKASGINAQQIVNYKTGFGSAPDNISSTCNLFNQSPQFTIGSFKQWPVSGGVVRASDSPIELKTRGGTSTTTTKGTAFAIEYPIKSGYKYSISINAYRISPQNNAAIYVEVAARQALPNPNTDGTNPTACGSVQMTQLTAVQSFRISGNNLTVSNNTAANVAAVQNWTAPQDRSFFTFLAYGGNNDEDASVFINSITITETAPISFNLSPTTVSLACGATTAQTFTVNNVNNTPNVTYTWNLGNNNGWLHNGSAAPSTISTGSSNSITLVPDCGNALSNITATATVGGTGHTTNASTVSITQPTYSISGASAICSGSSNYSITGLLCNSSVVWTTPPSNIATLSSLTSSPTTLTYVGNGDFTLTANVTSCGVTTTVTLPVHVGSYSSSDYTLGVNGSVSGYLPWCPGTAYGFSITNTSPGSTSSNFSWTIPQGWTQNYISGYLCVLNAPTSTSPPTGTINVSFTDGCGTTINKSMFLAYSSSACTPANNPCFQYSPNPAPNYLNVNVASGCIGSTYIRKIELVQASTGNSVYFQDYTYGNVTSTSISTYSYPSGTYYLRIYDGSTWSSYTIMR